MKKARKLITFILTVVMVLSMSVTTMAAELTINNTTPGKSYDLYKVLDLSHSEGAYHYTVNTDFENFFEGKKNEANALVPSDTSWDDPIAKIEGMKGDKDALSQLAKEILAWATDETNGVEPVETVNADEATETVSGLEDGYYLLNPLGAQGASNGNVTMFSLGTLSEDDTEISVKAEYPTLTKVANKKVASIGEDITFTLTSKVPDMTGYNRYYFVVNDTLSEGLTFQSISSIKVGNEDVNDQDYTIERNDSENSIKIVFKDFYDNYSDDVGDIVEIIYTAELNVNATINGDGNDNTASLTYSNDPKYNYPEDTDEWTDTDDNPTNDPIGKTPEKKTTTYTTELIINKTDGNNPLSGAAFQISGTADNIVITTGYIFVENDTEGTYYKLTDGTYVEEAPSDLENPKDPYVNPAKKYKRETVWNISTDNSSDVYAEAFVNDDGVLKFTGLGVGTYTIAEIVTPQGYNPIPPMTIVIEYDDEDGFTYTKDGGAESPTSTAIEVINNTGSELPSTGGIGTTIFYIVGGALVLFAVVLLVTKKRMKDNQ